MTKDNKNKNIMTDIELNALAIKIVSRMVKLRSMEDWFSHVSKSSLAWQVAYEDLELTEEYEIGLTNNEDDKVIPGFENQPEFPSLERKTIEPMYYHQEEKS